jgi:hypothetical protein
MGDAMANSTRKAMVSRVDEMRRMLKTEMELEHSSVGDDGITKTKGKKKFPSLYAE